MNHEKQGTDMSHPLVRELSKEDLEKVSGAWWIRLSLRTLTVTGGLGDGRGDGNVGMRNHQG